MNNLTQLLDVGVERVSLGLLVLDLVLTGLCAWVLNWYYVRFGQSLSNKKKLARVFLWVAVTTALIISVVKSSLALSLGLVGALSIVRFRTAIKEPEEIAFLFLAIGLGLGFGANQHEVTLVAFVVILILGFMQRKFEGGREVEAMHVVVSWEGKGKKPFVVGDVVEMLKAHTKRIDLIRVEEGVDGTEVVCEAEFLSLFDLEEYLEKIMEWKGVRVQVLDRSGLVL